MAVNSHETRGFLYRHASNTFDVLPPWQVSREVPAELKSQSSWLGDGLWSQTLAGSNPIFPNSLYDPGQMINLVAFEFPLRRSLPWKTVVRLK